MPISSISSLRLNRFFFLPSSHPPSNFRVPSHSIRISIAASENPNPPRKPPPDKNLLKAKDSVKQFPSPSLNYVSQASLTPNQAVGFVAAAQANFMRVIVQSAGDGSSNIGTELLCVVRAVLKKIRRRVLVGDRVLVGSVDWVDRRGMIEDVFKRNSEIMDPPVANVDHVVVLFSVDQPKLEPYLLTRFLVEAESVGVPATLALNKVELVEEETLLAWKERLSAWGYKPLYCSVNSKYGLTELAESLKGQTSVIVGPSGVGKSSLINALRSSDCGFGVGGGDSSVEQLFHREISKWYDEQRVGEVSTKSGRGKHTTRHVSLLPLLGGGYLVDTPGFSQPSLLKVTGRSLAYMFPEVRQMLSESEPAKCSFNDCLHVGEPGCVVKGDWERNPYYLQLLDEIKIREEFQLRTLGTKRESDMRYKMGDGGVKQAEPLLKIKKHRRQSRKSLNQSVMDEFNEMNEDDDSMTGF